MWRLPFDPDPEADPKAAPEPGAPRPPLYVTRPTLPPLEALRPYLEEIWRSRILTNHGPLHARLEAALAARLGVPHLSLVANATLGLLIALRHLGVAGEVVTTPFSFVATAHAIRLAGAEPVFADVEPGTLNLDPAAAAARIGPRTSAILAVHAYGVPCDHEGLSALARRHGLPLVYDAAHAMGAEMGGRSLASLGDVSVLSFHATKVFGTFEGGAVVAPSAEAKRGIDLLANHGIEDEAHVPAVGLNAKMSEIHAAFGLALLPLLDDALAARGIAAARYQAALRDVPTLRCLCPPDRPGHNSYAFPILVDPAHPFPRDALHERLRANGIFARRYFWPLISDQPPYRDLPSARRGGLPVAAAAADRVLCLPLFPDIAEAEQDRVIELVRG